MFKQFGLLIISVIFLSGCDFKSNSSSSATSTADTTAPTVSSTTPASSATNIDVDAAITITFSEGMLDSTINTTNITMVNSSSAAVTGTVTIDSDSLIATFTPSASLSYTETYTVSLSTSITDDSNNALASIYSWSFSTNAGTGAWNTATDQVSSSTYNSYPAESAYVAMDNNGNAMAVWVQGDGIANSNVFANYYTASSSTWGTAIEIDANDTYDATSPHVAFDGAGNAMVVWTQSDGNADSIYYNVYTKSSSSWGTANLVDGTNNVAESPKVGMDSSGNAIAVWRQWDGTYFSIYSNLYTGTWAGQVERDASTSITAFTPDFAMNSDGNAILVWRQSDSTYSRIYASTYAASNWVAPVTIDLGTDHAFSVPKVAINSDSNATVIWRQNTGTASMYANRYTSAAGTPWGTAELIETSSEDVTADFEVATDSDGDAIAVFVQSNGTANSLYMNRYTSSWGTATLIETSDEAVSSANITMHASSGNAVAVWAQSDGSIESIYSNIFTSSGSSWGTAEVIESSSNSASSPDLAIDNSGNAMAVWSLQNAGVDSNLY